MKTKIIFLGVVLVIHFSFFTRADDGYRLWLKYDLVSNQQKLNQYQSNISHLIVCGSSETMVAASEEMVNGIDGLLGTHIVTTNKVINDGTIILGTPQNFSLIGNLKHDSLLRLTGMEGFIIRSHIINQKKCIVVTANTDIGVLYGVFHFLRLLQTGNEIASLHITSSPKIQLRLLNHWDNLNGRVERGYAGESLWRWFELPEYQQPRYKDYARANASIGINGTVLNNVNATPVILSEDYLVKVASIAEVFRPYGIKVFLAVNFSSPKELGGLSTADPLEPQVVEWWKKKADEIYKTIPDFGGFLVKANSEGLPGPQDFGRTHADGANMLAEALEPHGGVVMWRAFVYHPGSDDRAKQGYQEFVPLDGKFKKNVLIQVKNGPIDFQPREPFHPLFGAMPKTPLMMEFQITQEYLGFATHLVYLAPLYKECLESETFASGKGSTVARIIDGKLNNYTITGIAGVSNIGSDRNWCGHPFGAANWYAFGRLAWDHNLTSEQIAEEWIRMTFSNDQAVVSVISDIMLGSHEATVNYMTPIGLHHLMGWGHHYGPQPWLDKAERPDWNSVYYHRADDKGVGFDRTVSGSNAANYYFKPLSDTYNSLETCPENLLLWFHHVDWKYKMKSGRTLWDEICFKYYSGVDTVRQMQKQWNSLEGKLDAEQFKSVKARLSIQVREALWWRDACILYFQTFSKMPIPEGYQKPVQTLEEFKKINWKFAPGI